MKNFSKAFVAVTLFLPISAAASVYSTKAGEILIKFSPKTSATTRNSIVDKAFGGSVVREIPNIGWSVVQFPSVFLPEKAVKKLKGKSGVQKAETVSIGRYEDIDDPSYPLQYGIPKIHVPEVWPEVPDPSTVRIAVLDSGAAQTHPDVVNQIETAIDFSGSSFGTEDLIGHGTHVAGITAAQTNNGIGVAGVARNCKLFCGKVGDFFPDGTALTTGIVWAADNGANVIQMSLSVGDSQALHDAVDYAWGKNLIIIDAAGNSNTNDVFYPASYENCIAVAATDDQDRFADFSNYGDWVDVAAPGVDIFSTYANGTYEYLSGTSMAAPHVSGVAGLMWSYAGTDAANQDIRDAIEEGCDPLGVQGGKSVIFGRVNAANSLDALVLPVPEYVTLGPSPRTGTILSGTSVDLQTTDDSTVVTRSAKFAKTGQVAAFDATIQLDKPKEQLRRGSISITSRALRGVTQQIYLFNVNAGEYQLVKANQLRADNTTVELKLGSRIVDYVNDAGELKLIARAILPDRMSRGSAFQFVVDQIVLIARFGRAPG